MIDIYMTSFYRMDFTKRSLEYLAERTMPGSYQVHIFDNASDKETRDYLYGLLDSGQIASLHLDSRNTGCLYNKAVFQAMTESSHPYYVVTDNDIYPPKLSPDWLSQMVSVMDRHPEIVLLSPQILPIGLMGPVRVEGDVVYCAAVGNALKMVRRALYPKYPQALMKFGDDGMTSKMVREAGYMVAFCKDIFCFHAGQCENWGYREEEVAKDPRKAGYGKPFSYEMKNFDTFEPVDSTLRL